MNSSFFDGKRDWSEVKDRVLSHYITAYLKKVQHLRKPILLVDAFAGPGVFDDGKPGSPLLMCNAADRYAPGNWHAIFVNKEKDHHDKLKNNLADFQKKGCVTLINDDAKILLNKIQQQITNHTIFLYLDPFGLKGCDFNLLVPLLERVKEGFSTEILINVSMPTIHREGARNVVLEKGIENLNSQTLSKIKNVDMALGGDYWRKIEWNRNLSPEEREKRILNIYKEKFKKYMDYVMCCPVRESETSHVKYYITLCSRHVDALVLMNDTMGTSYNNYMHEKASKYLPLFANGTEEFFLWERGREKVIKKLENIVVLMLRKIDAPISRKKLWERIVENYFMQFIQKEYRKVIKNLVDSNKISATYMSSSNRLNDDTLLSTKTKY